MTIDLSVIRDLIYLNGLSTEQVLALSSDAFYTPGWVYLPDGGGLPLVTQVTPPDVFNPTIEDVNAALEMIEADEDAAHRKLSGAIWHTSTEGRLIREQGLGAEVPILPLRFTFPFSVTGRLQPDDPQADEARKVLQAAADWLERETLQPKPSLVARVRGALTDGKTIFLLSGTAVNGVNLLNNLLLGRLLSPAAYGQLTLLVTLQLFFGLLPTAAQTVTARFSAGYAASKRTHLTAALYRYGRARLGTIGLGIAVVLMILAPFLTPMLQLNNMWLFLPVALATPFFVVMGVERGILQGREGYGWLSGSYVAEGIVRFAASVGLAILLANAGRALDGAVWGVGQGMFAAWVLAWVGLRGFAPADDVQDPEEIAAWRKLFGLTLVSLMGQAFITNSDFLLVKTFFSPEDAGLYAAVSVIGRITYFGALPVLVLLVPLVSRRQALDEPTLPLFLVLFAGGGVICAGLIGVSVLFAPLIIGVLYGEAYVSAAPLLAIYTLAASLFVLTNFIVNYRIALGRGDETWMPLVAGILQFIGILVFHDSLLQVILVQVALMATLLGGVAWRAFRT